MHSGVLTADTGSCILQFFTPHKYLPVKIPVTDRDRFFFAIEKSRLIREGSGKIFQQMFKILITHSLF